jgi:K+-transporting ATPase ATPase C chain
MSSETENEAEASMSRTRSLASYVRQSASILIILTVLTGVVYPLFVLGVGQALFHHKAEGSLIVQDGKVAGSSLLGQPFTGPGYFWSRPSATAPYPYNAAASSGSNLGPTNPDLLQAISDRIAVLRAADPGNTSPVPIDLVTASALGGSPTRP